MDVSGVVDWGANNYESVETGFLRIILVHVDQEFSIEENNESRKLYLLP